MNVLKKRVIPCVLAVVLVLALAVPSFASEANYGIDIDSEFHPIEIRVALSADSATALINPYGLPYELKLNEAVVDKVVGAQIASEPLYMYNKGDVPLRVSATASAELGDSTGMSFAATADEIDDSTDKLAFVYFQMASTSLTDPTDQTAIIKAFAAWEQSDYNSDKDVQVSDTEDVVENIVTLSAVTLNSDGTDVEAYTAGSLAMFRLAGKLVEEPADEWTEDDMFSTSIAFTFRPDTTSVKFTADNGFELEVGNTATTTVTPSLSDGGMTIDSVVWTYQVNGEDVTPAEVTGKIANGITVLANGGDPNAIDVTVAAGAEVGPTIVTATATVTNTDGVTYVGSKDITVTGDTTVTLTAANSADSSPVDDEIIVVADNDVTLNLTATVGSNSGASLSSGVTWALETNNEDGIALGTPSGTTGANTLTLDASSANAVSPDDYATVTATIVSGGNTYVATYTVTVVDVYTVAIEFDDLTSGTIAYDSNDTTTLTVTLTDSNSDPVEIASVAWSMTTTAGVTLNSADGNPSTTVTVDSTASSGSNTVAVQAEVTSITGVTCTVSENVTYTGNN